MSDQCVLLKLILTLALFSEYVTAFASITANKLYFRNENLTTVPKFPNHPDEDYQSITQAIFSHNRFNVLTTEDFVQFSQYPNIKYALFDHNSISRIDGTTFSKIPKLKVLDLSNNKLTELPNDLYTDLIELTYLQFVNLKRNPINNFKNIDKLVAEGVQVEYDGVLGREKKLRMRNRRVASDGSPVHHNNDFYDENEGKDVKDLEHYIDEMDEAKNMTVIEDKPVKAFVVDHKTDHHNILESNSKPNNFLGSIIFNFLAAFLVLVALPIGMVIYYFMHRKDGIS